MVFEFEAAATEFRRRKREGSAVETVVRLLEKVPMRRLLILLAAFAAAPALAQPHSAGLFISPAGEPFRAGPGQAYPLPRWFAGADADGNGEITFAEFDKDALRFFDLLDTSRDGRVNSIETKAYETNVAPEIVRRIPLLSEQQGNTVGGQPRDNMSPIRSLPQRDSGPARLKPPREGAGFYALLNEPQPVSAADGDFNTIITREEWTAAARRRFGRLDANGDKVLRLDELPTPPVVTLSASMAPGQ